MVDIRFFALGGLGENGKNMYVVDVNRQYFILDAGLKYPSSELFGVDEIIPNFKMLLNVKSRIRGIFLTHAHEDHIGALPHILSELNVPIFATSFTMDIIKDSLREKNFNLDDLTLNVVDQNNIIRFNDVKVTFFNTTHSIPESVGVAIHTLSGVIVYTSDFTFTQSGDIKYQTDFKKINELAEKNVIALLTESLGSSIQQSGGLTETLNHKINSVYSNAEGRIIVSLFSSDLQKIQRVIDLSIIHKKKIAIIGRRAQRIVDIAIEKGYLSIPAENLSQLRFIDDKIKNDDKDLVCLVTGSRHEPFYMLQRMCRKQDRLIHINENDTILLMTAPVPGTEKMAARTLDILYRSDARVKVIDKRLLSSSHATNEEIKMMINLLKPRYIIPVIGEYRHQYGVKALSKEVGYKDENIILLDNGDAFKFNDEKGGFISRNEVRTSEILIDGTAVGDINDYVMRDREMLAADGVVMVVCSVNPKTKQFVTEPLVVSKGFAYLMDSQDILEDLKEVFKKASEKHLKSKYINWNEMKNDVRDEISKYIYQETKRRPIMIPVIISSETRSNDDKTKDDTTLSVAA